MTTAQVDPALSPRLQRAMEAAKARGLAVFIEKDTGIGAWIRINNGRPAQSRLSLFESFHILVADTDGSPESLIQEAATWAEHARVILAAADGVSP